jgi:hypothetical protein
MFTVRQLFADCVYGMFPKWKQLMITVRQLFADCVYGMFRTFLLAHKNTWSGNRRDSPWSNKLENFRNPLLLCYAYTNFIGPALECGWSPLTLYRRMDFALYFRYISSAEVRHTLAIPTSPLYVLMALCLIIRRFSKTTQHNFRHEILICK